MPAGSRQRNGYNGNHRSPVCSDAAGASPFIVSGRCGLVIATFHGDGAPW
jgi:hypothetical protein